MKLRKLISCVAAASIATAALATAASAELVTVEQSRIFFSGTGNWMPVIYSDGTFDSSEKDVIDYGLDLTQIGYVEVTLRATDPDWFEGGFGGAIVLSSKSEANSTHNWNGKEYWGTIDEDLGIETAATDKPVVFQKVGDYTYTGVMTVDDTNCVFEDAQLCQIAIQEWGGDMSPMEVVSMVVKDKSGNVMISFDSKGNATVASASAPVEETAPVEESAPAAGDVSAETDSTKGSPDTGVADVAAVAGLALVAGGAFIVAKKRK